MKKMVTIIALTIVANTYTSSALANDAYCFCEHYATVYDGLCEVFVTPYSDQYNGETYYFEPFGGAILPFGFNPQSSFGYYDLRWRGLTGGLNFAVTFPSGQVVGGPCSSGT